MTPQQALQLTVAKNLGTARNTLAPGLALPAYVPGMDPNQWASRIQAMGLARLQPAGNIGSFYKFGNVPGSFDIGSSAPGSSTIMIPKGPEEREQAIQAMMGLNPPKTAADNPFASGKWIFGDTIGGMQQGFLSSANLDEQIRRDRAAEALAAQKMAADERRAREAREFEYQRMRQQEAQQALQNYFGFTDRDRQSAMQMFDAEIRRSQLLGQGADEATLSRLGLANITEQQNARKLLPEAQDSWNRMLQNEVASFNKTSGLPSVGLVQDRYGNLIIDKNTTKGEGFDRSGLNDLQARLSMSDARKGVDAAVAAIDNAELNAQRLKFLPKTSVAVPNLPNFGGGTMAVPNFRAPAAATGLTPQVIQQLRAAGVNFPTTTAAAPPRSTAIPFILQDQARHGMPLPQAPRMSDLDWLDAFAGPDPGIPAAQKQVTVDALRAQQQATQRNSAADAAFDQLPMSTRLHAALYGGAGVGLGALDSLTSGYFDYLGNESQAMDDYSKKIISDAVNRRLPPPPAELPPPPAELPPTPAELPIVTTQNEYDKLPPGARYKRKPNGPASTKPTSSTPSSTPGAGAGAGTVWQSATVPPASPVGVSASDVFNELNQRDLTNAGLQAATQALGLPPSVESGMVGTGFNTTAQTFGVPLATGANTLSQAISVPISTASSALAQAFGVPAATAANVLSQIANVPLAVAVNTLAQTFGVPVATAANALNQIIALNQVSARDAIAFGSGLPSAMRGAAGLGAAGAMPAVGATGLGAAGAMPAIGATYAAMNSAGKIAALLNLLRQSTPR